MTLVVVKIIIVLVLGIINYYWKTYNAQVVWKDFWNSCMNGTKIATFYVSLGTVLYIFLNPKIISLDLSLIKLYIIAIWGGSFVVYGLIPGIIGLTINLFKNKKKDNNKKIQFK